MKSKIKLSNLGPWYMVAISSTQIGTTIWNSSWIINLASVNLRNVLLLPVSGASGFTLRVHNGRLNCFIILCWNNLSCWFRIMSAGISLHDGLLQVHKNLHFSQKKTHFSPAGARVSLSPSVCLSVFVCICVDPVTSYVKPLKWCTNQTNQNLFGMSADRIKIAN